MFKQVTYLLIKKWQHIQNVQLIVEANAFNANAKQV